MTLSVQNDRVQHFVRRMKELGRSPEDIVITLINVDDVHGRHLADILMPGHDWQQYRDQGQIPYARGLAERQGIQEALGLFDEAAAAKLRTHRGIAVVVVDYGVAEIFNPAD